MSRDIDPVKDAMLTGLHACGFGPLNAELCRAHIMRALTAANYLIVPRAVVEEAAKAIDELTGYYTGNIENDMGIIAKLRACIPAAADKQGAG